MFWSSSYGGSEGQAAMDADQASSEPDGGGPEEMLTLDEAEIKDWNQMSTRRVSQPHS